jgi:hypothetical protein
MGARGIPVTTYVSLAFVSDTRTCSGKFNYLSWGDIANFHAKYGWSIFSAGSTTMAFTQLTDQQVYDDSCGSISTFTAHGIDPTAMFAYPGGGGTMHNARTDAIVNKCFRWLRVYSSVSNALRPPSPYLVKTYSITGGPCVEASAACYTYAQSAGPTHHYTSPASITQLLNSSGWSVIQPYRFVTGTHGTPGATGSWDCSGANWRTHWTEPPEVYCYTDFLMAIDAAQTTWTSPAAVSR